MGWQRGNDDINFTGFITNIRNKQTRDGLPYLWLRVKDYDAKEQVECIIWSSTPIPELGYGDKIYLSFNKLPTEPNKQPVAWSVDILEQQADPKQATKY